MTQPIDIISRALKDIGALEAGEAPTADAAQDAFDFGNGSNRKYYQSSSSKFTFTLVRNN